jgi:hypothetical protein
MDGPTITIRKTRASDLAALDAMFARSYPILLKADYPPSALVTALPLISRAQPNLITSGNYYLAEVDGQVVAAGGWSWRGGLVGLWLGIPLIRPSCLGQRSCAVRLL